MNWFQKTLSALICSLIATSTFAAPGSHDYSVLAVHNQLQVQPPENRTDQEIAADVRARLRLDQRLDPYPLRVEVQDGTVYLRGAVRTTLQKYWAKALGWVAGAQEVDTSGIAVRPYALDRSEAIVSNIRGGEIQNLPLVEASESRLRAAVRTALALNPVIDKSNVQVRVDGGAVTLTGTVPTVAARQIAQEIASGVAGVQQVANFIVLRPTVSLANEVLADRITQAIQRDPYLNDDFIRVRVTRGNTMIAGTVDSEYERERVGRLVSRINGVTSLTNAVRTEYF